MSELYNISNVFYVDDGMHIWPCGNIGGFLSALNFKGIKTCLNQLDHITIFQHIGVADDTRNFLVPVIILIATTVYLLSR